MKTDTSDAATNWGLQLRAVDLDNQLVTETQKEGSVPVIRGRMVSAFSHCYAEPDLWIDRDAGVMAMGADYGRFRIVMRTITSALNSRSLVATILPPGTVHNASLIASCAPEDLSDMVVLCAYLNSFVCDWELRLSVMFTANSYLVHQLHIPRPERDSWLYREIARTAGCLLVAGAPPGMEPVMAATNANDGIESPSSMAFGWQHARVEALVALSYGFSLAQYERLLDDFPLVDPMARYAAWSELKRYKE